MSIAFTLGRIALVASFLVSGAYKLIDFVGTAARIQSHVNIPAALSDAVSSIEATVSMTIWETLAVLAAAVQVLGALLIALDVFTRTAAVMLFIYSAATIFYLHDFWNMPAGAGRTNSMFDALTNLSIMGMLLMLATWQRRRELYQPAE